MAKTDPHMEPPPIKLDQPTTEMKRRAARECQQLARALGNLQSSTSAFPALFARRVYLALCAAREMGGDLPPAVLDACGVQMDRISGRIAVGWGEWLYRRWRYALDWMAGRPASVHRTIEPREMTELINALLNVGNLLEYASRT